MARASRGGRVGEGVAAPDPAAVDAHPEADELAGVEVGDHAGAGLEGHFGVVGVAGDVHDSAAQLPAVEGVDEVGVVAGEVREGQQPREAAGGVLE